MCLFAVCDVMHFFQTSQQHALSLHAFTACPRASSCFCARARQGHVACTRGYMGQHSTCAIANPLTSMLACSQRALSSFCPCLELAEGVKRHREAPILGGARRCTSRGERAAAAATAAMPAVMAGACTPTCGAAAKPPTNLFNISLSLCDDSGADALRLSKRQNRDECVP